MSKVVTRSLRKQLEQVIHQLILEFAQKEDKQQMQPIGNELVNVPTTDATHRAKANEPHQNATEPTVQRDLATLSTIPQETPPTSTQPQTMSVYHDDNHELV
jgi:hypothetical protein